MSQDLQFALAAQEAFSDNEKAVLGALGPRLLVEFAQAEKDKRLTEERMLRDLRQYRGQYDPEVLALIGPKRSRAFLRKTRVKVKTVDSRVEELLFPSGIEKNYEVGPSQVPSIPKEQRTLVIDQLKQMMVAQAQAAVQQGQPVPAKLTLSKDQVDKAVLEICKEASKKMANVIEDQLAEIKYKATCKQAIHSGHLYGTGIIKGPLVEKRVRSTFVHNNGKWAEKSETYVVPFIDYVPVWRFYPDMGASELSECRYVYERHQMTYADVAELAERKTFNKKRITDYLKANPNGQVTLKYIDSQLKIIGERLDNQGATDGKYEVLERWGWLTGQELSDCGVKVDADRLHESFFSNVWLLPNGEIIKAVLQPINGVTWPYHMYYFDKDETSIFGDGLAAVIRDDQTMVNAATRMMLDNGAITSGPMVEVALGLISNMDQNSTDIEPWKVILRNALQPGVPAVRAIELPSNLQNLSVLADRFDNNIDEVSAVPRYMTGEGQNDGAANTKGGLSMLMGAANIMIKDLIGNWDEGVTEPFIGALYRWNMQFHPDNSIKGDFNVKARGSASLVAREVRAGQLDQFSAAVANPLDAPFIKRDKLLRQRAEANELSDVVKTEEEVKAEQDNGAMAMQQQLQMQMAQGQLAELMQKVAVLTAQAAKAAAEVELVKAKATEAKVASVYSALQAGGVAVSQPQIAPAGDEILRSSGWKDATPDPTIAQLSGPPVQAELPMSTNPMTPDQAVPAPVGPEQMPNLQPQTGQVGMHQGIETEAIDA